MKDFDSFVDRTPPEICKLTDSPTDQVTINAHSNNHLMHGYASNLIEAYTQCMVQVFLQEAQLGTKAIEKAFMVLLNLYAIWQTCTLD